MIVKRLFYLEDERLFSDALSVSKIISDASYRFCEEVVKICEMFTKYTDSSGEKGKYTLHWIKDKLWGQGLQDLIRVFKSKSSINPLIVWFYKVDDERRNQSKVIENYESYSEFIDTIKKNISIKYGITRFKFTDKEYYTIFKYIALVLSGIIIPELYQTSPWWGDSVKTLGNTIINYLPYRGSYSTLENNKSKIIGNLITAFMNINEGEQNGVLLRALENKDFA